MSVYNRKDLEIQLRGMYEKIDRDARNAEIAKEAIRIASMLMVKVDRQRMQLHNLQDKMERCRALEQQTRENWRLP